jgi:hypothetical protein
MHMPSSKVMPPRSGFGDSDGYAQGWSRTIVSHRVAVWLSVLFCAGLLAVPLTDALMGSWREPALKAKDGFSRIFGCFTREGIGWSAIVAANNEALSAITGFETSLEDSSALAGVVRPSALDELLRVGGAGSEEAYIGRDGWLFYRPDVDALVMQTDRNNKAAEGIADFAAELAKENVRLVVVPIPGKASIHPEKLAADGNEFAAPPVSPVLSALEKNVESAWRAKNIADPALAPVVINATDLLWRRKGETGKDQFLKSDSHWAPDAVNAVAQFVAQSLDQTEPSLANGIRNVRSQDVTAIGDTALMLKLPESSPLLAPQTVNVDRVESEKGDSWNPDRSSDILVLGDSYTNIYSSESLGWGGSAGFAEQLSRFLGYNVDKLSRNDAGAESAREMLAAEAARNPGWLEGKKVVIWVMAAREFVRGDWTRVDLDSGRAAAASDHFFVAAPGSPLEVDARIVSRGPVPVPGESPYADYLTALHLSDLRDAATGEPISGDALAYVFTMRDHRVVPSPDLIVGGRARLRLSNYTEQAGQLDSLNRGEIDDVELMMQEPNFAEWTTR